MRPSSLLGTLIFLALPSHASTVLFNQAPPGPDPNAVNITDFRAADDFTLGGLSTVTDILFYYRFADNGAATDLGDVTYAIYANSSGWLPVRRRSRSGG